MNLSMSTMTKIRLITPLLLFVTGFGFHIHNSKAQVSLFIIVCGSWAFSNPVTVTLTYMQYYYTCVQQLIKQLYKTKCSSYCITRQLANTWNCLLHFSLDHISITIKTSLAAEGFAPDPYIWYLLLVETPSKFLDLPLISIIVINVQHNLQDPLTRFFSVKYFYSIICS